MFYKFHVSNYLNAVNFKGDENDVINIKERLIQKLNIDFSKAKNEIKKVVEKEKKNEHCDHWIYCKNKCEKIVRYYMKKEIESTAYFLKVISESIINIYEKDNNEVVKNGLSFTLNTSIDKITGKWEDDYIHFDLNYDNHSEPTNRLIMGFGPSASGKTFWATTIIKLLSSIDDSFPKIFISIDGGLYRESSLVYSVTRDVAIESCYAGFSNLVLAGISLTRSSLFKSDSIKSQIINYLSHCKTKGVYFSLYVPETLGDCGGLANIRIKKCKNKYKPYIELVNDIKWIGLMIWQHKFGKDCNKPIGYKCTGTTESGTSREKKEGKKYSNSAWFHSMKLGIKHLKKAKGGRYMIHNSGQKNNLSILSDYTPTQKETSKKIFEEKSSRYGYSYKYMNDDE